MVMAITEHMDMAKRQKVRAGKDELGLTPPKTLARSRNLTFEDFVLNAKTIFAGEPPKRID